MKETRIVNIRNGEKYDVYIGRPGKGTDGYYGNPHTMGGVYCSHCKSYHDRRGAIAEYKKDFYQRIKSDLAFKKNILKLAGKTLGCFCVPLECHGNVIKEYLDNYGKQ